jgi:DNA polymerase iota
MAIQQDIGRIPGIGFKMAQLIRNHVLSRPAEFEMGLIYGPTKESVSVRDVRLFPGMGPEILESILGGPGAERGIGGKVWNLMNGVDDTEVQQMRKVPSQISIEDSYIRLDTMPQALKEMQMLATSLLHRMHTDLMEDDEGHDANGGRRWIALPKTIRLSTRLRPPLNADGTRSRSFNRTSRSGPLPGFVFNLKESIGAIVEKLVQETLLPMFRRLHPQQSGWNLSLINICVTNLLETASDDSSGKGRDISKMFKRQESVLREWKVEDRDVPPDPKPDRGELHDRAEPSAGNDASEKTIEGSEDMLYPTQSTVLDNVQWEEDDLEENDFERCTTCGASLPAFAMPAHERFHVLEE